MGYYSTTEIASVLTSLNVIGNVKTVQQYDPQQLPVKVRCTLRSYFENNNLNFSIKDLLDEYSREDFFRIPDTVPRTSLPYWLPQQNENLDFLKRQWKLNNRRVEDVNNLISMSTNMFEVEMPGANHKSAFDWCQQNISKRRGAGRWHCIDVSIRAIFLWQGTLDPRSTLFFVADKDRLLQLKLACG